MPDPLDPPAPFSAAPALTPEQQMAKEREKSDRFWRVVPILLLMLSQLFLVYANSRQAQTIARYEGALRNCVGALAERAK